MLKLVVLSDMTLLLVKVLYVVYSTEIRGYSCMLSQYGTWLLYSMTSESRKREREITYAVL